MSTDIPSSEQDKNEKKTLPGYVENVRYNPCSWTRTPKCCRFRWNLCPLFSPNQISCIVSLVTLFLLLVQCKPRKISKRAQVSAWNPLPLIQKCTVWVTLRREPFPFLSWNRELNLNANHQHRMKLIRWSFFPPFSHFTLYISKNFEFWSVHQSSWFDYIPTKTE